MNNSSLLTLKEYDYNSFQSLGLQRSGPVAFRDLPVQLMLSKTFYTTYSGSLGDSEVKNLPANTGDAGSISGLGKISPGGGKATHSSILAWENPWPEEPGRLQYVRVTKELDMT